MAKTKEGIRPFENHEREQTLMLLGLAVLKRDKIKVTLKEQDDLIETLKGELEMGGRADENQGALPGIADHPDDADDALPGDDEKPASDKPPPMHAAQQQAKKKAKGVSTNGAVHEPA